MQLPLKQKLFYFFPILFCFCLPFGMQILSLIIVLWVIVSFFNIDKRAFIPGLKNRKLWLFYSFFLVTLFSAMASENREEAFFSVEVKMSFLLFPYLLFCFKWPLDILKRCVISFASGCFFACIYLMIRAFIFSLQGHPEYFFYSDFSDFIHTSYFAMYLVMATVLVIVLYPRWFKLQKSVIFSAYFFVGIFITSIFLCSSKLGLISFFITILLLFVYKWKLNLTFKKVFFIVISFLILIVLTSLLFPTSLHRLRPLTEFSTDKIDKTSAESTTVRVLIWQRSIEIIKNNFLFGTGAGDANQQLYDSYERHELSGAFQYKLNAHNQFLQSFIGLGVAGFLLLIMLTFGEIIRGILDRKFLLFVFSLLITMNFMVESMLQRSAGVLFFSFFLCFFTLVGEKDLSNNNNTPIV